MSSLWLSAHAGFVEYCSDYPLVGESVAAGTRGTQNRTGVSFKRGCELSSMGRPSLPQVRGGDARDVLHVSSALRRLKTCMASMGSLSFAQPSAGICCELVQVLVGLHAFTLGTALPLKSLDPDTLQGLIRDLKQRDKGGGGVHKSGNLAAMRRRQRVQMELGVIKRLVALSEHMYRELLAAAETSHVEQRQRQDAAEEEEEIKGDQGLAVMAQEGHAEPGAETVMQLVYSLLFHIVRANEDVHELLTADIEDMLGVLRGPPHATRLPVVRASPLNAAGPPRVALSPP